MPLRKFERNTAKTKKNIQIKRTCEENEAEQTQNMTLT